MSNAGREFRDNRWGDRLMLCSWGWTTCQLSAQIIITKKGVCKIDEVYVFLVSSAGRGRLLFWHISSHEVVQIQVNIGVFPICCCKQRECCQERSSKLIWVMICGTLGAWRGAPRTLNITFRLMWLASFVCTIDYISKGHFFSSTPKQQHCLITHRDPELTQRDCSQTPCGLMNSSYWLLQSPLRRSLWKALTVHCGLYMTVEKPGSFSHLRHIKVPNNTEEQ